MQTPEQAAAPHPNPLPMPEGAWGEGMPVGAMRELLTGVPEGFTAFVLARLAQEAGPAHLFLHVARDDRRLEALAEGLAFVTPQVRVIQLPAWDTVPYDRIGPNAEIVAMRIAALARLAATARKGQTIVLTTANAILQRVPSREFLRRSLKTIAPGQRIDLNRLAQRLNLAGYQRTGTVMEPGEYAVRGGILDLFPPARQSPVRLDFFGDTLEHMKAFDPETQRTGKIVQRLTLMPMSEVAFGEAAEKQFRRGYMETFGPVTSEDPLYEAVSAGQRYPGMEHWLPLFHEHMETLFDYVPDAAVSFDHLVDEAVAERLELIADHYDARVKGLESHAFGAPPYKPVPPKAMFLMREEWDGLLAARTVRRMTPFEEAPDADGRKDKVRSFGGRAGRSFAAERATPDVNAFDAAAAHVRALQGRNKRVIVAAFTPGARERLATLLGEHDLPNARKVDSYLEAAALPADTAAFVVLGLEQGFETADLAVIGEQDILGDRLVRPRRARRAADVITEATSLGVGDLVVHADHGIGRFDGLTTITALGAPHDCLEIGYAGGDKLYLPVENIELLSRYGSADGLAQLDRLGGVAWQTRKARLKQRIREIAADLIKVAALRQLRQAPPMSPPHGPYEEFTARFPYDETDEQATSIDTVLDDLSSGKPMDRLVCGDVGFGKTEVGLRAAFVAALAGYQVAVVVPTTLLARQHYATFSARFKGLPVRIAQLSRLVAPKELAAAKAGIKDGTIDIAIGTHALLGKSIDFARLGLLIVDEEQHFGVVHKERLKQMREDVHVLTLTATPIPRTLQLALSGVRELSLITTPPVDRLAVRTYISPFDPVIVREALRRERYRGGQSFYVVPRISDLEDVAEFLGQETPELQGRPRPRPALPRHAGRRHERLLRRQVRRAAVHGHRRIRPRHRQRQHADRAPRRHVRPRPALSAPRPRRPLQDARLRLFHHAQRREAHPRRREAPQGPAVARHLGRRLLARLPRPRHPRRRQPAGRGAVRPHPRGRLRALPVDAGGGGRGHEGRRSRRDGRPVEPADLARHLRADPRELRRRLVAPPRPLPAAVDAWTSAPTSTPLPPSWSTASASCPTRSATSSTWSRSRGLPAGPGCKASTRVPRGRSSASARTSSPTPRGSSPSCRSRAAA